jgi:thiol-disulfide isomerase/thioredoxin
MIKKKTAFYLGFSLLTLGINGSLPFLERWVENKNIEEIEFKVKETLDAGSMTLEPYWIIKGDSLAIPYSGELFSSRFTILNFWAPWCPPCIKEMPLLSKYHEEVKMNDVSIIGITGPYRSKDSEEPNQYLKWVKNTISNIDISYPLIFDIEAKNAFKFKARSLPLTVLLDHQSRIIEYRIGIKGAQLIIDRVNKNIK